MSLDDMIGDPEPEQLGQLAVTLARQRRELATLRRQVRSMGEILERRELELAAFTAARKRPTPRWVARKVRTRGRGIIATIWSDSHLDEVVNPAEMTGNMTNAYNRDIARTRWESYVEQLCALSITFPTYQIDGLVFMLGGDLFSGDIHDELRDTNESTMLDSVAYWTPVLASGIRRLADQYGSVHVANVIGNHGRTTRRPVAKRRAISNYDHLVARLIEQRLADDARITFAIPESADALVTIYDTTFLLTHGDQASGGSASIAVRRLRDRKAATYRFDWIVCGHFHTYHHADGIIINGTAKGPDEYSLVSSFVPTPPSQAVWLVEPDVGVTWSKAIYVADRAREGW
jgi:UDP-2,3-diacylglucosamine pyrophosphatase LpxH